MCARSFCIYILSSDFHNRSEYVLVEDLYNYETQSDPEAGNEKCDPFRHCH